MKDDNFLKENNARHLWHPMGHPGDAQINAPKIIKGADGAHITDIDDHRVVDAVGGLWCVNLGYSNDIVKDAIAGQLYQLPYYSAFAGTSIAIPRACPSFSVPAPSLFTKVFSTAAVSGWYFVNTSHNCSYSDTNRDPKSQPCDKQVPFATCFKRLPDTCITPHPRFRKPGSIPNTRICTSVYFFSQ